MSVQLRMYESLRPETFLSTQVRNSGKFKLLAELLPRLKADGHRPLLFSQWTSVRSPQPGPSPPLTLLSTAVTVSCTTRQRGLDCRV